MSNQTKRFTSRSAVLTYQTCPLKRYLQYHVGGFGFTGERYPLDLLIGSAVHRGIQHLLEHCRLEHADGKFEEHCIDNAVNAAKTEVWQPTLEKHSLWLHSGEESFVTDIIQEQECLFEGLIRAFAIHKLPYILDTYEILEVEHEEVYEDFTIERCKVCFGSGTETLRETNSPKIFCKNCNGTGKIHPIVFLGKADGLFRIKSGSNVNKLVVLSIKTSSEYPEVTIRNMMHDMQGVSEWTIIQDRLDKSIKDVASYFHLRSNDPYIIAVSEEDNEILKEKYGDGLYNYFKDCLISKIEPKIFAVVYEHLLKGKRRQYPYGSGIYKQDSFLAHPLKQDSLMSISNKSVRIMPDEYKWKKGAGRMAKGWGYVDIYNDIGIKNWVEMLATGQIQPEEGHPFDSILKTSDLVIRTEEEIEEWKVSTRFQEETIAKHLDEIESFGQHLEDFDEDIKTQTLVDLEQLIWKYFPKVTTSCHSYFGKDCVFVPICHENVDLANAIEAGVFVERESHHENERLYQIERKAKNK